MLDLSTRTAPSVLDLPGLVLSCLLLALGPPALSGQEKGACDAARPPAACRPSSFQDGGPSRRATEAPSAPSATSVLASLIVPGAGQLLEDRDRGWAYVGVEVLAVLGYLERSRSAADLRDRYRDLAWEVARIQTAPRTDGDFGYYETLADYGASGAWDRRPNRAGLQPETDPSTFNGRIWNLAREIYLGPEWADPDSQAYQRALDYYRERGYGPDMRWSWSEHPESRDRYRDLIERSDDRFRQATIAVGLVLGNHILSAVDVYVSSRLGAHDGSSLTLGPVPTSGSGPAWGLRVALYI